MTRARDIADLVDANGDIVVGALDNVPASNDASALTTGTLAAARLPASGISASAVNTGTLPNGIFPAGTVLQVITTHAGQSANTISTTSYTAIGLDINITPKQTGSHFICQAFWLVYKNGTNTLKVESALFRNGTNITGNLTHTPYAGSGAGLDQSMPYGGQSTTDTGANAVAGTPISYSYKFKKNATGEITYDIAHNDAKSAFLTIMEIAQ